MASSIGRALAAAAIGQPFAPRSPTRRYWIAGTLCAVIPDLDAIGRPFGWGDVSWLGGHRAFTHSISFALLLGLAVALIAFRNATYAPARNRIALYLIAATASHGALDLLVSYGAGVALLSPFTDHRFVSPWRPIGDLNEILYIWLPAALVVGLGRWWRPGRRTGSTAFDSRRATGGHSS